MVVVGDGPSEGRPTPRRGLELLPAGLMSRARRGRVDTSPEAVARAEEAERVLKAAVDALLGLARRTPGFDVTVTVNGVGGQPESQDAGPAVRIHYAHEGLIAHRLNTRGRIVGREAAGPVLDESEVVSELASMLWLGEVEPR